MKSEERCTYLLLSHPPHPPLKTSNIEHEKFLSNANKPLSDQGDI